MSEPAPHASMKTLLLSFFPAYPPDSGAAAVTYNCARHMPGQSWLVQMAQAPGRQTLGEGLELITLPWTDARLAKLANFHRRIREMVAWCRHVDPDLIVLEGASWAVYHALLLRALRRAKLSAEIVYHAHNVEYHLRRQKHGRLVTALTHWAEGRLIRDADRAFACSPVDQDEFERLYGSRPGLLPNGVDFERFDQVAPDEIEQDPGRIISSGEGAYDALSTLYDASVDELDDAVGDLLAVIDDLDDEPIVIICADHGQLLGEDGMYGHQFSVAEELVHVPLLVRGPGIDAGRTAEQLELRQLYDAIPRWAGLTVAEPPVETADIALGGYAFPDLASKTLTAAARERYYQQLRFGRRNGKKLTETTRSAGDPEQETIDLVTGTTVAPDDALVDAVTDIGTAEAGTSIAEKDEQVKDRLEDLGYM